MKSARCLINDCMVFSAWNLCLRFSDSHVKNTKYTLLSGCQPCGEIWSGEGYLKSMFPQHSHLNVYFGAQISKLSIKNKTNWTLSSLSGKGRLSYHQNLLVNATVTIIINGRSCTMGSMAIEFGNCIFFYIFMFCASGIFPTIVRDL